MVDFAHIWEQGCGGEMVNMNEGPLILCGWSRKKDIKLFSMTICVQMPESEKPFGQERYYANL